MELGIEKCTMLIMKSRKSKESIRKIRKESAQ